MSYIKSMLQCRVRFLKTIACIMAFTAVGLQLGIQGPSLLDLQILTSCTFEQISWVVTFRSVGFALGSGSFPIVTRYVNVQLIMGLMVALSAACIFIIPFITNYLWCIFVVGLSGLANGLNDTAILCFIVQLWGTESAVFLHAVYFGYGSGNLIVPLILKPFLLPLERESDGDILTIGGNSTDSVNSAINQRLKYSSDDVLLATPFLIVGVVTVPVAIFFFVLYAMYPKTEDHPSRTRLVVHVGPDVMPTNQMETFRNDDQWGTSKVWTFMMVMGLFSFIFGGMEFTFGAYISAYAVKSTFRLDKQIGALMASVNWIFYTTGRVLAAFLTALMGPRNLLVASLVVIMVAAIILTIAQSIINVSLFWFGLCLIGLGFSSIWGTVFGFMETKFRVDGPIVTTNTLFACVGSSLFPALLGALIDDHPDILIYYILAVSVAFLVIIVFAVFILPIIIPNDFRYSWLSSNQTKIQSIEQKTQK